MNGTLDELLNAYKDQIPSQYFDSNASRIVTRQFALGRLTQHSDETAELILIYNMSTHICPEDPAGLYYAINMISGPLPKVDLNKLGRLLCELAVIMT